MLRDLSTGAATSRAEAAAQPGAGQAVIDTAREEIIAAVAAEHRARVRVREWLEHPDSHAVEVHGPQVSDRDLELRAGWIRPPNHGTDGADTWRFRESDQKVVSKHSAGIEASRFTTPEAFARPLDLFLDVAARHPGGVTGLLDERFPAGVAPIFISAERAQLGSGDGFGYGGAGTGTPEAAWDWVKLRAVPGAGDLHRWVRARRRLARRRRPRLPGVQGRTGDPHPGVFVSAPPELVAADDRRVVAEHLVRRLRAGHAAR